MNEHINMAFIPEGIINIDTQAAKHLYFTSDRFDPHS